MQWKWEDTTSGLFILSLQYVFSFKKKRLSKGLHPGLHCAKVQGFAKDKLGWEGDTLDSSPRLEIWANQCYVEPVTLCQEETAETCTSQVTPLCGDPMNFPTGAQEESTWPNAPGAIKLWSKRSKQSMIFMPKKGTPWLFQECFFRNRSNIYWDHDSFTVLANWKPCLIPVIKRFVAPFAKASIPGNKWLSLVILAYTMKCFLVLWGNRSTYFWIKRW